MWTEHHSSLEQPLMNWFSMTREQKPNQACNLVYFPSVCHLDQKLVSRTVLVLQPDPPGQSALVEQRAAQIGLSVKQNINTIY